MMPAAASSDATIPPEPLTSVRNESAATNDSPPRLRTPRSLPPWIDSYEARYGAPADGQLHLLDRPPRSMMPQHNNLPSEPKRRISRDGFVDYADDALAGDRSRTAAGRALQYILKRNRGAERGRKWDHLRSADPVIVPGHAAHDSASPWRTFVHSSEYGHLPNEEAEIVDVDMLDKLQPGFNDPIDIPRLLEAKKSRAARTAVLYKRIWSLILRHPLVPLAFRLTVLLTSIIALALSARIYEIESALGNSSSERAQAIAAIVVDSLAVPYIGYMTWDEYTGKPLGLRPPTQKISLILMDLFFIIFKSVSTTLAFEALVYHSTDSGAETQFTRALAAFQTVGLISWTLTFMVNVFRLVQRLGGVEDDVPNM